MSQLGGEEGAGEAECLSCIFLSETEVDFRGVWRDQAAALPSRTISHGLKNERPLSVCSWHRVDA